MIESVFDPQSFQAPGGIQGHKTVITLGAHPSRRRLSQGSMGLERFMKDLHVPPFLVDCFDSGAITGQIAAGQIQRAGAAILVCKDLAEQQDGKIQSFDPAVHRLVFGQRAAHLCG